ncbi:CDP-glycerol glycerophosphotransferase family protein [Enterococcus sp. JM9B]|uniref:CDP-glycerol glycerophosphotransferase family protein n=1 Tax=Enterococcus sp. JM9B TaxID=1857216 RepID=UPI001374FD76|nr:CDP-glycerol glycerophosphotransferase family protein [Enterococcus sp. JM9B]KAF1304822.1 hypothetical protein BAU16_01220 [Enterococcus sp. JM9B]
MKKYVDKVKKQIMTPKELKYLQYRKQQIQRDTVLLESAHGKEISGHIYYIAKKLKEKFPRIKFYIALQKGKEVPEIFKENIVVHMSKNYLRLLATSKILINDTSFWSFFHKRMEQKYFIFWHGTPLKCLGKSTQVQGYGNVQRNLASADKIFVNNKYTGDILRKDFGIKDIINNELVIAPSPRNAPLFEMNKVVKGRYLYMPTWRDKKTSDNQFSDKLKNILLEMDSLLSDKEELYVKLHPYEADVVNLKESEFNHIKLFPKETEVYEFLQTVEKLVTDYSSIMFDFFLTKRSIILFTYDEKEYIATRKLYESIDSLPFKKAATVKNLFKLLRSKVSYSYEELVSKYAPVDCLNGQDIIINYLIENISNKRISVQKNWNGKENVLIYAGKFEDNGITSSLVNLLETVDLDSRNYILTWRDLDVGKDVEYKIEGLPNEVFTFISAGKLQCSFFESINTLLYMNEHFVFEKRIFRMYNREFDRLFPNAKIKHFIHYTGYDRSYATWVSALKERKIKTSIFVHTDMEKEFQLNKYLRKEIIFNAYRNAENVICVSEMIKKKIDKIVPSVKSTVVNVLFNKNKLIVDSKKEITEKIPEELISALNNDKELVFINIGRFSRQKGLDRLIQAFESLEYKSSKLVIIGKYGPEKHNIYALTEKSVRNKDIFILDTVMNPYNILRQADSFVFSSRYEGLGMVVIESLLVGTPVIMANIAETIDILAKNRAEGVTVVDNSIAGLIEGMENFVKKPIERTNFDYTFYKQNAIQKWEGIFIEDQTSKYNQ